MTHRFSLARQKPQWLQNLVADHRMRADQLELFFGQLSRLAEDVVHDGELAEVVQHPGPAHQDHLGGRHAHDHGELAGIERHARRVALEVRILGLQRNDERRDGVDQVLFEVLAQEDLLERDRGGLRVTEQERLLIGQEGAVLAAPAHAEDPHRVADPGHQRGESFEVVLSLRQRERLLAAGLDDVAERGLQQRHDLADEAGLAPAAGIELAGLVSQQHDRAVAAEALHRLLENLFDEDARLEPLQRDLADAREHFDTGLAPRQLLRQSRGIVDVPVAVGPIPPQARDEITHLGDRERLRQVVVRAVAQPEHRRVDGRHAGDQHDRRPRLLALDGAEQVEAAQTRHLDVGHHEVERIVAQLLERLLRGPRGRDLALVRGERRGQEAEHRGVVVDQEDAQALDGRAALGFRL